VLFASAAFVAGARTLVASAFGLNVAPACRASLTSLRAATMQLGYFLGSIAGGIALATRGYDGVGLTMSAFFLAAAVTLTLTSRESPASAGQTTQAQPSQ
jgi:predicted MFS family arabinose efflux permease